MTSPSPADAGLPSPLEELDAVSDDIFARWDRDMRSGKLLAALSGRVSNYDPRVTRVREALARLATTEAENARLRTALSEAVAAWNLLPGDQHYTAKTIEAWMGRDLAPAFHRARAALAASTKEPAHEQA